MEHELRQAVERRVCMDFLHKREERRKKMVVGGFKRLMRIVRENEHMAQKRRYVETARTYALPSSWLPSSPVPFVSFVSLKPDTSFPPFFNNRVSWLLRYDLLAVTPQVHSSTLWIRWLLLHLGCDQQNPSSFYKYRHHRMPSVDIYAKWRLGDPKI